MTKPLVAALSFFFTFTMCLAPEERPGEQNDWQSHTQNLNPKAMDVLRQMSDFLKRAPQYTFRVDMTNERLFDSEQNVQFERQGEIRIRRPDRIWAEIEDDDGTKRFFYSAKSITLYNLERNLYARAEAPPTIDEMLDFLIDKYGIDLTLGDFVSDDPYESMSQFLKTAAYVGESRVRGRTCHHLAFTQESVDWQLWVDKIEEPVPRKLVIIQKKFKSRPQYRAVLSDWDFSVSHADSQFEFTPPEDAHRIQFLPVPPETANAESDQK